MDFSPFCYEQYSQYSSSVSHQRIFAIMTTNFDKAFQILHEIEGGYSNNMHDRGGKTMYGITESVARAHGYTGEMDLLPIGTAKSIYKSNYWLKEFDDLPFQVAYCIFDACVNHGVRRAVLITQRIVKSREDGLFGPNTYALVVSMGADKFIKSFCSERLHFYTSLHEWNIFGKGWTLRIARILAL